MTPAQKRELRYFPTRLVQMSQEKRRILLKELQRGLYLRSTEQPKVRA